MTEQKTFKVCVTFDNEVIPDLISAQAESRIFNRSDFIRKAVAEKIENILSPEEVATIAQS